MTIPNNATFKDLSEVIIDKINAYGPQPHPDHLLPLAILALAKVLQQAKESN